MIEKRFDVIHSPVTGLFVVTDDEHKEVFEGIKSYGNACRFANLLNTLHEENMNNRAKITRFKLIVSDIVDDLEKQAKSEEPIVISMDYVQWIKSELDLKLNGLKR